jgi:hypothetical protein
MARRSLVLALAGGLVATALAVSGQAGASPEGPAASARKVRLAALPPVAQPGRKPAKAPKQGVLSARFRPAHPGATVLVQRLKGHRWSTVQHTTQKALGWVVVGVKPGTYRLASGSTTTTTAVARHWKPAFADDFQGRTLSPARWKDQVIPYGLAGLRSCAQPSPKVRRVARGVLQMGIGYDSSRADRCALQGPKAAGRTTRYLLNTQVVTEDRFTMKYGYVAARVRFGQGGGRHSGVWIAPSYTDLPAGADATEIDISEFFGRTKRPYDGVGTYLHVHKTPTVTEKHGTVFRTTGRMLPKGQTWWNSFHVVSVEWSPSSYVFRVDGQEYWRAAGAPTQGPGYLALSSLTSDYEIPKITPKNLKDVTSVDWIRAWSW